MTGGYRWSTGSIWRTRAGSSWPRISLIRDQDVVYVATAPGAEIREFLATVTSLAFSAIAIGNVISSDGGGGNPGGN